MSLRDRVEKHDTWFDRTRASLKAAYSGRPLDKILEMFEFNSRRTAVFEAYAVNQRLEHGRAVSVDELMLSQANVEQINNLLSVPLPPGNVVEAAFAIYRKHREALNGLNTPGTVSHLIDFIDSAVTHLHIDLLVNQKTELMVVDSHLAKRVIAANNEPLRGEDLYFVPFERMILEFSEPIDLIALDGNVVKAVAVGFYKNLEAQAYAINWYTDLKVPMGWDCRSAVSICFSPYGLSRILFDLTTREKLGLTREEYGFSYLGSAIVVNDKDPKYKEKVQAYRNRFDLAKRQLEIKSRNIWDFVTSRNISYESCERPSRDWSAKIKKYKHLQGRMDLGPRTFRVLSVNKDIVTYPPGTGQTTSLGDRQHVPGHFRKLVYCKRCHGLHRHDLIGMPCRKKCQNLGLSEQELLVGPADNITVEKFWVEDYWRGPEDGPVKQVVYEVQS